MARKQLAIGKWADIEVAWHLMLDVLKDLDIFSIVVPAECSLRKMLRCHVPEQHLKFSIKFKGKHTENPFFEFALRDGESAGFHQIGIISWLLNYISFYFHPIIVDLITVLQ